MKKATLEYTEHSEQCLSWTEQLRVYPSARRLFKVIKQNKQLLVLVP